VEKMKDVFALIQARTGARRLSNKVLLDLGGKTVLEHVISRVNRAKTINEAVVVTTVSKEDLKIVELVSQKGIRVLCGSEDDVLDRYYQAARLLNAQHIVRITADCPVIDADVIDQVVNYYFKSKADYCSNALSQTFPDGLDVEVFSFDALAKAWKNTRLSSEREHVTPYIRNHQQMFKVVSVDHPVNLGAHRWTLDEKKDYMFLKELFDGLYRKNTYFGMNDILRFLEKNPKIININAAITRNEGYTRSLRNEKVAYAG
jgi:spore coat polysaccharide biosynthesis protein SpsF (cytidylyltransferase family)